jgi:threonine/homoserine/homoserine lactone efflux protein
MVFAYILQGMAYGFAAATQPGPFQTYLILQALKRGWKRTLPMALAPLLSDGPIILLVLLVLTQVPLWLVRSLRVAGGFFLIYLAIGAWRTGTVKPFV